MQRRRIIYILILAVTFWLMLMYTGVFIEGIFLTAVLFPALLRLFEIIGGLAIAVRWAADASVIHAGEKFYVRAFIRNRLILPVGKISASFEIEDPLGEIRKLNIVTNMGSCSERSCTVEITPNYSGIYTVRLTKITVYDWLGLSGFKRKNNSKITLAVYPEKKHLEQVNLEYVNNVEQESEKHSEVLRGSDRSEIFDIDAYSHGDNVKDIHWKLTTKTDEILVKRYSMPVDSRIHVMIDFGFSQDKKITLGRMDAFYKNVYSFIDMISEKYGNVDIYTIEHGILKKINRDDIIEISPVNTESIEKICGFFCDAVGNGTNILMSARIGEKELEHYQSLKQYFIEWKYIEPEEKTGKESLIVKEALVISVDTEVKDGENKKSVKVNRDFQVSTDNQKVKIYTYLLRILFVAAGSFIPMAVFYDTVVINDGFPWTILILACGGAVVMACSRITKKTVLKVALILIGALAAVWKAGGISNIAEGAVNTVNAFGNDIEYGDAYGLTGQGTYSIECFMAAVAFVFTVILFLFTWESLSIIIHLVITLPFFALCLIFGMVPNGGYTVAYGAYTAAVTVYSVTYSSIVKRENGTMKKAYYESTVNIAAQLGWMTAVIVVGIMMADAGKGYFRPQFLSDWKQSVNEKLSGIEYGISWVQDSEKITALGGLNEGKLGEVDKIQYSNDTVLDVTVSGKVSFPIYLKGYTGTKYTGNSWKEADETQLKELNERVKNRDWEMYQIQNIPYNILKSRDEISTLEEEELYGENSFVTENSPNREPLKKAAVAVKNEKTWDDRYYIPYWTNYIKYKKALVGDGILESTNNSADAVICNILQLTRVDDISARAAECRDGDIIDMEEVYRKWVKETYSEPDISDRVEKRLRDEIPWEYNWNGKKVDLSLGCEVLGYEPYIDAVREYLRENYDYSIAPGKLERGRDFIEKFMDTGLGYCTYYATAATEIFRIYGIPSRYAEGFYVMPNQEEMNEYTESGRVDIKVSDKYAHAWTEIYIDGFGWIQVEATEGFDSQNYHSLSEEESSSENITDDSSETETQTEPQDTETTGDTETSGMSETKEITSENENGQDGLKGEADKNRENRAGSFVWIAIVVGTVIFTLIFGRKSCRENRNEKKAGSPRMDERAIWWQKALTEVLNGGKPSACVPENATREQMASHIAVYLKKLGENGRKRKKSEISSEISEKDILEMYQVFDRAVYGKDVIDEEIISKAANTAKKIIIYVYDCRSLSGKIYIRYIKCLYFKKK